MNKLEIKLNSGLVQKGSDFPIENARAHLVMITGMDEYSGRYKYFAEKLNSQGISVHILDHWGQGENAESIERQEIWPRGAWNFTQESLNKLVMRYKEEGKPVYIMGHSMGSFAVQNYLINFPNSANKAIIMASNGRNNRLLISLGNILAKLLTTNKNWEKHAKLLENLSVGAYAKAVKDRKTEFDWISYDEENVQNYIADPYCGHPNSFGFFHEFMAGLNELYKEKNLKKISKDERILVIAGEDDPVGANSKGPKELKKMYDELGVKDCQLKLYPHMRHEILNEREKDAVIEDIWTFLNA